MHPHRIELHNELHARPSIYFNEPAYVFHAALLERGEQLETIVTELHAMAGLTREGTHTSGLLKLDEASIKWERHTEFLSLTMVLPKPIGGEFWPVVPQNLKHLVEAHQELLINFTQLLVESEPRWEGHSSRYGFKDPAGSEIGSGDAVVWSDFRLDDNGINRMLLVNRGLNAYRLGRMVRRLLEIETYRMMASLALPDAKAVNAQIRAFDNELTQLSERNAAVNGNEARAILDEIAALSARVVRLTSRSRRRFSATEAYSQLVLERIAELRETHVGNSQRLGVFIERRFNPTVRYCSGTFQRLERLADSVAHLGELLQARVQVEVEEQNSAILKSLNTRATAQIKIQKAVEGLSIIAISYYLLSLFKLMYEALHSLGMPVTPREAALYLAPVAFGLLGWIALRIHRTKETADE